MKENSIQNFETRMLIATLLIARNLPYNQIGQAYGARDPWRGSLFGSRILYPTSAIASAKTHRGVDTHKVLGIYIYTDPYYTFHDQHLSKLVNNFKKNQKQKKKNTCWTGNNNHNRISNTLNRRRIKMEGKREDRRFWLFLKAFINFSRHGVVYRSYVYFCDICYLYTRMNDKTKHFIGYK